MRPLHDSPGKPLPLPRCRAVPCQDAALPAAPSEEADRQTGRDRHAWRQSDGEAAQLPCCSASPDMHQCHGEGCDSRQLSRFPVPQAGVVPAPKAFVSISAQASAAIARDSFKAVSGGGFTPNGSPLPPTSHRSLPCIPRAWGRRAWDKHGKSKTITPELVPVAQRANAPQALPLAAIPRMGTARPLHICFPAAGSQRLRAASGCVHFDTKSRRAHVSDCKYLACCSRLIAGSWDQAFPRNCTVALQDKTVTTLQHTSAFERRTLQFYRTVFPFNSLRL